MASSKGNLSPLQNDFLVAWFKHTGSFFLTGGAVLVGFLGAPRITKDLDLFTTEKDAFDDAAASFDLICNAIEARFESVRTAPFFRRYLVSRAHEETIIDMVLDKAPQIFEKKQAALNDIIIDRPEEILTNKICAITGRSEARDFFDAYYLTGLGYDIDMALEQASLKDGGINRETMLFVLSGISWDAFTIPGCDNRTLEEVRSFFQKWAESLALSLFPRKIYHPCTLR